MSAFELAHLESDDERRVVVSVQGELDLTNVAAFERALGDACPPGLQLLVDLDRVRFIDSAALHCLFRLARTRGRARLAFAVAPESPVARALSIVDLQAAVTVAPTVEAARAALAGAPAA